MKKIKRPHFYTKLINGDVTKEPVITESDFNEWFDDLLKNSVRVYGSSRDLDEGVFALGKTLGEEDTHTALLIDIQPIKKETAEDVLVKAVEDHLAQFKLRGVSIDKLRKALEEYQAALGESDE